MFCKNCGKELIPGKRFCGGCGAPVEQSQQPVVQNAPVQSQSAPDRQEKKDNKTKKIVAIILAVVIVIISCAVGFGVLLNRKNDEKEKEALRKAVEDYTTKQILTFYYEDYDADGNKEAFAIAGDGEEDGFKKADIIYVDRKKKPETVSSDINGRDNGIIESKKTKYISVEVEKEKEEDSRSFVYGIKEEEVFEPEISGKYQDVHQEDKGITATDPATGNEIVINVDSDGELAVSEESTPTESQTEKADENSGISLNAEVVETIKFGKYEQDNDTSNGKEDIEWIVLAKENGRALIISKYALDFQPYNEENNSVTWETCTLRKWLNEDFYNTAFSSSEQSKIQLSTVTADKNPQQGTSPGNDTQDKVFLLSCDEVDKYFSAGKDRRCAATAYAKEQGLWLDSDYTTSYGEEACSWWLRTPGGDSYRACGIFDGGAFYCDGGYVDDANGVRPALWINL